MFPKVSSESLGKVVNFWDITTSTLIIEFSASTYPKDFLNH
jgi:hypothetical protein